MKKETADISARDISAALCFERIYEVVRRIPRGKVASYGQVAALAGNRRWSRVVGYALHVNPDEAGILAGYMARTAESGTAAALSGNGYTVAGKTGSAEYERDGETGTHSWFCGFAQTQEPHIAIAVIAEDGGTGSATAVPIAKQILDAFFYG